MRLSQVVGIVVMELKNLVIKDFMRKDGVKKQTFKVAYSNSSKKGKVQEKTVEWWNKEKIERIYIKIEETGQCLMSSDKQPHQTYQGG